MKTDTSRLYFPNLDGLRFITAFLVLINHIEIYKSNIGSPNISHVPFIEKIGEYLIIEQQNNRMLK